MYRRRRRRRRIKTIKIRVKRRRRRPRKMNIRKRILGRGVSRPYTDKRNRLMLGSGSSSGTVKQKGGFFPLTAALTVAPPIIDLLGKIIR